MSLANAIALQEVRIVIGNVLTEMLQKLETFEKLMFYINSFEDIARHKDNIRSLVDIKKALSSIELPEDVNYELPKYIRAFPNPSKELQILFNFFKSMHFSFWEIRTKLHMLQEKASSIDTREQAIPIMRVIKDAKSVMEPTAFRIQRELDSITAQETEETYETRKKSIELTFRQEKINLQLQQLSERINAVENEWKTNSNIN